MCESVHIRVFRFIFFIALCFAAYEYSCVCVFYKRKIRIFFFLILKFILHGLLAHAKKMKLALDIKNLYIYTKISLLLEVEEKMRMRKKTYVCIFMRYFFFKPNYFDSARLFYFIFKYFSLFRVVIKKVRHFKATL